MLSSGVSFCRLWETYTEYLPDESAESSNMGLIIEKMVIFVPKQKRFGFFVELCSWLVKSRTGNQCVVFIFFYKVAESKMRQPLCFIRYTELASFVPCFCGVTFHQVFVRYVSSCFAVKSVTT